MELEAWPALGCPFTVGGAIVQAQAFRVKLMSELGVILSVVREEEKEGERGGGKRRRREEKRRETCIYVSQNP